MMDAKLLFSVIIAILTTATKSYWVKEMEAGEFEGDIVLRGGIAGYGSVVGHRWPGVIQYSIHSTIGKKGVKAIRAAIADYEKYTCLRFKQIGNKIHGSIHFYKGVGCTSPIGYSSIHYNDVSLAEECWEKGTVLHEIGHSIGFYHEQNRSDRDQYIEINWQNMKPEGRIQFRRLFNSLDTKYDLQSIMHYGSKAFSANGKYTIKVKNDDHRHLIGNNDHFSHTDIVQINKMYCPGVAVKCENEGKACGFLKFFNRCRPAFMLKNCKKSCKFC